MFKHIKRIHFVGIGGIGMSGIAEVLINMGYEVRGSDLKHSSITKRLNRLGAVVWEGHDSNHVTGADVVIYSSAVRESNPEIVAAKEANIPIIPRAEMLAELMRMKSGIAVAGTHGKTTTTSLIGKILTDAGWDPTLIIGGRVKSLRTNARLGSGEYFVCEADESDRTFLMLSPTFIVLTSLEEEHLDRYKDLQEIRSAFIEFSHRIPFYGTCFFSLDDPNLLEIREKISRRTVSYGVHPESESRALNVNLMGFISKFEMSWRGENLGEIQVKLPGEHNVLNALSAATVALELGISFSTVRKAISGFTGVERRFEKKGEVKGILVMDDYGHHPTEIKATLKAARQGWKGRIIAVFQPHLYSRTQFFASRFGESFTDATRLIVTDVYPSREEPVEGISGEMIVQEAKKAGHSDVLYFQDKEEVTQCLSETVKSGDLVITIGAGDIYKVGEKFLKELKSKNPSKKN
jgi:UDP-N-acetylmuramate--alanine ligase